MAINKNAQLRYLILDRCLRSGRKWNWKQLLDAVNEGLKEEINHKSGQSASISKTQLYEDLKDLEYRVYKAPIIIEKIGRTNFYKYEDKDFSIQNAPLNDTEISQLKQALQIISRATGKPEFNFIKELIPILESKFGIIEVKEPVISYEFNEFYKGAEWIPFLFNSIVNKQALSIKYKDFDSMDAYTITFHPYHLRQYNNRWFVFGYNCLYKKYNWTLALDRIIAATDIQIKYHDNNQIDWNYYFEDIIGVTKPEGAKVDNVTLHFFGKAGRYVDTKPLHGSQRARWIDESTLEVKLELILNYELESLLFSFANNIKILKPVELVQTVKKRLTSAESLYL